MNKRMLQRTLLASLVAIFAAAAAPRIARAASPGSARETRDEFFIVSEVNLQKHQIIFELPTQITKTMDVSGKTTFVNGHGQRMPVSAIHAGDTVFVTYVSNGASATVLSVREGPMTVEMLHHRYWNG